MHLLRLYARVLTALGDERRLAWMLALANVTLVGAQFAEPVLFGRVVDQLTRETGGEGLAPLWRLLGIWVGVGLFNIACNALVALHADRLAHRQRQAVLTQYFEHVLELPLAYHGDVHSGRLMRIMLQGTDSLWSLWLGFFREHLAGFASFIVILPLALLMNWRLASVLIVLCAVLMVLTWLVMRRTDALQKRVEEHYSELAERAADTLGNIPLVHSFTRVEAEVYGLKSVVAKLLAAQIPVLSWWAVVATLTRTSTTLTLLCVIIGGALLHARGLASVGEIVAFMGIASLLVQRLQDTVSFFSRLFLEAPKLQAFFDVLDTRSSVRDAAHPLDPGRVRGLVEFRNVTFFYGGPRPAVFDLGFTAQPGRTVALVGPTGAGKSTALALLHRTFDPQTGTVLIDGTDIRVIKLTALRRNIGVVFQEGLLFNRSIAENLRIGRPDASDDEVRKAAERAQALDFIEALPAGFDSRVGERGRMLSGGERQRLYIARALLKNPPILILDEATSALDARTETKLMSALAEVMKDRTTFVIAHRLATIRKADMILVFDNGRIVETGTFESLVQSGGMFAELVRSQTFSAAPADEAVSSTGGALNAAMTAHNP
ncbi:MAG TPA: glucan ABC transporter ATP-binding protein/ permease [Pseudolabrys sp.]|nr:glucan ABC transporter ATP-binding protein/ permease [Pseudolabrys sp.]